MVSYNATSKIFENILLDSFTNCVDDIDFQFRFKSGDLTDICTHTLKSTVDYYRRRGRHVFVCFIDYTKAFDSANYWKLFLKLIDSNIPNCLVSRYHYLPFGVLFNQYALNGNVIFLPSLYW